MTLCVLLSNVPSKPRSRPYLRKMQQTKFHMLRQKKKKMLSLYFFSLPISLCVMAALKTDTKALYELFFLLSLDFSICSLRTLKYTLQFDLKAYICAQFF